MRFLVDAQLPPSLAGWLQGEGHEAAHVLDAGLTAAEDHDIWALAVRSGAILITKDEDFLAIRSRTASGPAVVWLRIGNATNRVLIGWFSTRFASVMAALMDGASVVEVR